MGKRLYIFYATMITTNSKASGSQTGARKSVAHNTGRKILLKRVDFGSRSVAALEIAVQIGAVQRNCNNGNEEAAKHHWEYSMKCERANGRGMYLRGLSRLDMRIRIHSSSVTHMLIQNMRLSCVATTGR